MRKPSLIILFLLVFININAQLYLDVNSSIENVSCYGLADGAINLSISTNYSPYTVTWSNSSTTNIIYSLSPGFYTVTVSNSIQQVIETYEVTQPPQLVVTSNITDNICFGDQQGEIGVSVNNGNPPLSFEWSNNETTNEILGLEAGSYSLTVHDYLPLAEPAPINWYYTNTGNNQSIVLPIGTSVTINGSQISEGDWICAMYDSLGTLACGSSSPDPFFSGPINLNVPVAGVYYYSIDSIHAITIWGKESAFENGFENGELLKFFIWTAADSILYPMEVEMLGSTNYLANSSSVILSMTYNPNLYGCSVTEEFIVEEPDSIYTFSLITEPTNFYSSDGEISVNAFGGTPPYSYLWSTGQTSNHIDGLVGGEYNISIIDQNSCEAFDTITITPPPIILPDWFVDTTSTYHTVLIEDTIDIEVEGTQISYGDFIAAFYNSSGELHCGGYAQWFGENLAINTYGEDSVSSGFDEGEEFKWKIWSVSEGEEYDAIASYQLAPGITDEGSFVPFGLSSFGSLEGSIKDYQYINIPEGWSIISSYINPFEANIDSVFASYGTNINIVKDQNGLVYWPLFNINLIGNLTVGQGYLIKMNVSQEVSIIGVEAIPQQTLVQIPGGWSILGYLRKKSAPIDIMLAPIVPEIFIVKDGQGNVYWPAYFVNDIGYMTPGEGYLIKLNSQQNLIYPAN